MMNDPVHIQTEQMIAQRIADPGLMLEIATREEAARSLLYDLGPEYPDEIQERRTARIYLESIVEGD